MATKPLRIAVVAACPFPWRRGTPIRIFRICEALAARGHEVHVFTYHLGEGEGNGFEIHRIPDVAHYRKTSPGPSWKKLALLNPALVRLVRKEAQASHFDIVHAHHYEGIAVAAKACPHLPLVYDAHTTLAGELPGYSIGLPRFFKKAVGAFLDRKIPAKADHTIAVSESIRESLLAVKAVTADAIDVVPNGVESEFFQYSEVLHRDPEQIIFTGNDADYQRIDLLLAAFAILLETKPRAKLKLVGASDFSSVREQATSLNLGASLEILNLSFEKECAHLAVAGIAVSPRTKCDGIPQKLLNYMSSGIASVACEGSASIIRHEETGLQVANDDPAALAAAMARLVDDTELSRKLGEAAKAEANEYYSWEAVGRRIELIYAKTMQKKLTSREVAASR